MLESLNLRLFLFLKGLLKANLSFMANKADYHLQSAVYKLDLIYKKNEGERTSHSDRTKTNVVCR
jgi:hypothetical protein